MYIAIFKKGIKETPPFFFWLSFNFDFIMTTAQILQKRHKILENIVLLHYQKILDCNSIAKKAAKLKVYFEISELILQDEINGLFILHKNKFTLTKPETCKYLKKIEIYKRDKKVFLIVLA